MKILINRATNTHAFGYHVYVGDARRIETAKDHIDCKEIVEELREEARVGGSQFEIRFGPNIGPASQDYFRA